MKSLFLLFSIWGIDVFSLAYSYYDGQLAVIVKSIMERINGTVEQSIANRNMIFESQTIHQVALETSVNVVSSTHQDQLDSSNDPSETEFTAPWRTIKGGALFKLYQCLQEFVDFNISPSSSASGNRKLNHFYSWFIMTICRLMDMAFYEALIRIGRAVKLDDLAPLDSLAKFSSSAVDTATIFYQIKILWDKLAWPDTEGAKVFVIKIIDVNDSQENTFDNYINSCIVLFDSLISQDTIRCTLFYAEAIRLKLEKISSLSRSKEGIFFIDPKVIAYNI